MAALKGSILVTGSNGGLGTAFVSKLLKSPQASEYRGIYMVRNPTTATALHNVLKQAPKKHQHEIIALDLGSLEAIRVTVEDINARVTKGTLEPIRVLVLNAAVQFSGPNSLKPQHFTSDGFESSFAVNYLANFLLVLLLLQSMDKEHGRIVMISSFNHDPDCSWNNQMHLYEGNYRTVYSNTEAISKGIGYTDDSYKAGMRRYAGSKLLLLMFMYELQRRLNLDPTLSKVSVISLDPGTMAGTGIARSAPLYIRILMSYVLVAVQFIMVSFSPNGMMRGPKKSADDVLLACFDSKGLGEYPKAVYLTGSKKIDSSVESRDEEKQRRLWKDSLKLAMIKEGETALKDWQ